MVDESEEDMSPPHTEMPQLVQIALLMFVLCGGLTALCMLWTLARLVLRYT